MTLLEKFNECATKRGYNQTKGGVDWKVVNGIMYFRQSDGAKDWIRNFLAVIPVIVWMKGFDIIPLGAWLTYRQVRKIARQEVIEYVGYSQGGWPAVYSALENNRPGLVFGCPNATMNPVKFGMVRGYKNPTDCVTNLPPWASPAGRVVVLPGNAVRPPRISETEWLSGHTPEEYRQRMV